MDRDVQRSCSIPPKKKRRRDSQFDMEEFCPLTKYEMQLFSTDGSGDALPKSDLATSFHERYNKVVSFGSSDAYDPTSYCYVDDLQDDPEHREFHKIKYSAYNSADSKTDHQVLPPSQENVWKCLPQEKKEELIIILSTFRKLDNLLEYCEEDDGAWRHRATPLTPENAIHRRNLEAYGEWPVCTVLITIVLGLLYISSWNLVGITCTRYLAIRDPLRFQTIFRHKVAIRAVAFTWLTLITLACCLYFRPYPPDDYHCYKSCRYEMVLGESDVIFTTVAYVICPLFVMAVLWGHMTCIARKQVRAIVNQQVSGGCQGLQGQKLVFKKEIRMYSMAGILLGLYTIAWVPFIIFEFITVGDPVSQAETQWWRALVRLLLHSNTAVNVIVYSFRVQEFREAIVRDLNRYKMRCTNPCKRKNKIEEHPQFVWTATRPQPDGNDSVQLPAEWPQHDGVDSAQIPVERPQHNEVESVQLPAEWPQHDGADSTQIPAQQPQHDEVEFVQLPVDWPQHDGADSAQIPVERPQHDEVESVQLPVDWPQHDGADSAQIPVERPQHDGADSVQIPVERPQHDEVEFVQLPVDWPQPDGIESLDRSQLPVEGNSNEEPMDNISGNNLHCSNNLQDLQEQSVSND